MKIKYEFVTETVEIEVTDDWGTILVDLDRQEYNIDHKETRRHSSLNAFKPVAASPPKDFLDMLAPAAVNLFPFNYRFTIPTFATFDEEKTTP